MMRHILLITLFVGSLLRSQNSDEYSIGLSDNLGYFGLISKSWIKHQSRSRESYIVAGSTLFFLGGIGYGQKIFIKVKDCLAILH